jgi:excinuclease ABC subunit A
MQPAISLRGVRQNNLRGFDLDVPLGKLVVITGLSGSGKSSLAFDTLYAEGQRRYVECLSSYARQFIERMDKPAVDRVEGALPAVALRQGRTIKAARSTVASLTEAGEFFRLLFGRAAQPECPSCGRPVPRLQVAAMVDDLLAGASSGPGRAGRRAVVGFVLPVVSPLAAQVALQGLQAAGYQRAWRDGAVVDLAEALAATPTGGTVAVVQDRLVLDEAERSRLYDSLTQALTRGSGEVSVWMQEGPEQPAVGRWSTLGSAAGFVELRAAARRVCPFDHTEVAEPSAHLFSSASAVGACPACNGFGRSVGLDWGRVIPDGRKSLAEGAIKPWSTPSTVDERRDLAAFCERRGIDQNRAWQDLPEDQRQAVLDGETGGWKKGRFYGVRGWFEWQEGRAYKMHVRVLLARYRAYVTCTTCQGTRLRPEARAWKLQGLTLPEWLALPVRQVRERLAKLELGPADALALEQPLRELRHRVDFLDEVGLEYLALDRSARTLSGGELQRVQIVAALATGMTQVLYVLDEPSVGLHPRDNERLLRILERLRAAGNTVVVVEHDPALIRAADVLVDLGPGAGAEGGELLYVGPPAGVEAVAGSLTGDYLSGRKTVVPPSTTLRGRGKPAPERWLTVRAPTERNLRGHDVRLKLGALNVVCGVSGSGKSTLVEDVLVRSLLRARGEPTDEPGACGGLDGADGIGEVVLVDQDLPSGSSRANCATYLKVWDAVRARLADAPLAVQRGYTPATFSFNKEGGRCPVCEGLGHELVEMQFLSDVRMTCEACDGRRFRPDVLQVTHAGLNASQFLDCTAAEIAERFADDPQLAQPMRALTELGMGYLRLGQPLATLSGGEAQRVKIAWHLLQARTKGALFVLDEPSTGLHLHDVAVLLGNVRRLVERGNTVVLVEHHLDLVAAADHVIELGPEGGPGGGHVLFQGRPDELAQAETPTARFLRDKDQAAQGLAVDAEGIEVDPGVVEIRSARVHNLQSVSLDLPRDRFVVVTGLSGSGKSSLAFDVVFAEGQRRFLDCLSPYARQYLPPTARPDVERLAGLPPTVAIAQRTTRGGLRSTVATLTDIWPYLRLLYARCGSQLCPQCGGPVSGQTARDVAEAVAERFADAPLYVMAPAVRGRKGWHKEVVQRARSLGHEWLQVDGHLIPIHAVPELRRHVVHDLDLVVARIAGGADRLATIAAAVDQALALGDGTVLVRTAARKSVTWSLRRHCGRCDLSVEAPDPRLFAFTSAAGWCSACTGTGLAEAPAMESERDKGDRSMQDLQKAGLPDGGEEVPDQPVRLLEACPACQGSRLRPEARAIHVGGLGLDRIAQLGPQALDDFLGSLPWSRRDLPVATPILAEVSARCRFLVRVGLGYLSMGRAALSLSGGESQRIRLAAQLSSNLRGVLYVLDEPTIGLHPVDNRRVLDALGELVERGSGLVVVEHDEDTIRRADHVIEMGPGGGRQGGRVIFEGNLAAMLADPASPTGSALSAGRSRRVRAVPRPVDEARFVEVRGARRHNLREVSARFARGRFNVVTGVSGSGKSTLVRDLLVARGGAMLAGGTSGPDLADIAGLDGIGRLALVDQAPIGRTPRSCPATYIGILDDIRKAFAALPEAKVLGLGAAQFSFNVAGGRCEACLGQGALRVQMSFLPAVTVPCEACDGSRYGPQALQVTFKGASIADVLRMSLAEAAGHFAAHRTIAGPLELAARIGLGYLTLGQGSDTLSGGEAQRLKLVSELAKRRRDETLYVLDEPSTGLHLNDVRKLLTVLHDLVDRGDTLVVIEHQLDVVREADWLVDLGPGPGEAGGQVTWQGPVQGLLDSDLELPTRAALLGEIGP